MNELDRMRYLNALGLDHYVSRQQLPGAAPSRRLAIVRPDAPAHPDVSPPVADRASDVPCRPAAAPEIPVLDDVRDRAIPARRADRGVAEQQQASAGAVRFSLVAIFAGQIAWIEALQGNPLAREQVQLVHAMARAVSGDQGPPDVTQFDWPTHHNHQLDLGAEAARAGVLGFLQRQLEQRKCRGLVLLGKACESRVPLSELGTVNAVVTDSTLDMLRQPLRKRQVWRDLQPLVLRV